jgi:hypothetical protein
MPCAIAGAAVVNGPPRPGGPLTLVVALIPVVAQAARKNLARGIAVSPRFTRIVAAALMATLPLA